MVKVFGERCCEVSGEVAVMWCLEAHALSTASRQIPQQMLRRLLRRIGDLGIPPLLSEVRSVRCKLVSRVCTREGALQNLRLEKLVK